MAAHDYDRFPVATNNPEEYEVRLLYTMELITVWRRRKGQIRQELRSRFGIGTRQANNYLVRAYARISANTLANIDAARGFALETLEDVATDKDSRPIEKVYNKK